MAVVHLVGGLILLVAGAEALVRGASRLAGAIGISSLVIGLTVVAFGTSAPELAVSVESALAGHGDIAIGNVVGSNICNVLLILGLSALVSPLIVSQQLIRVDVPLMIAASVATLILGIDGSLSRVDGVVLFSGIVAYTIFAIRKSREESRQVKEEYEREFGTTEPSRRRSSLFIDLVLVGAGLALLVLGASWLVDAAVTIAELFKVNQLVIGLTIVAVGTSLPELATSLVASIRGERDIAVGNVVGSNIFNLLAVLGATALVNPAPVGISETALRVDIPIMILTAIICLPIFISGFRITRTEGATFLVYYGGYVTYLVMRASGHPLVQNGGDVLLWFAAPLATLTLLFMLIGFRARPR